MGSSLAIWRFNHKIRTISKGSILRIELLAPAKVHWGSDNWQNVREDETRDTGVGIFLVDLPAESVPAGSTIDFTFYWIGSEKWENNDFMVTVVNRDA
jgi:glucoamylase